MRTICNIVFIMLAGLIFFMSCSVIEPEQTNGSMIVVVNRAKGSTSLFKKATLHSVQCLVKKDTSTVYNKTVFKQNGCFDVEIDDLEQGDDYSVLIYGKNISDACVCRADQANIRITAGEMSQVTMTWGAFEVALSSPPENSILTDNTPAFTWSSVDDASIYQLQVSGSSSFSSTAINELDLSVTTYTHSSALGEGDWYWRVRAKDSKDNWGGWSSVWKFTVQDLYLNVTPSSVTLASDSGSQVSFNVSSNTTWSISDDSDWLSVSPASGSDESTVTVTAVSANSSTSERSATVTVSGSGVSSNTVTVTQAGTEPVLIVSLRSLAINSSSGSTSSFAIISNVSWSVSANASWLNVSPVSGSDYGTVTVTAVSSNSSTNTRNATVTVSGSGVIVKTVVVIQDGVGVTGTMTGNDGRIYQTIKIGDQWWMAENLRETEFRDGSSIPEVTDNTTWTGLSTGARCSSLNDETNAETYGYLYNWYAVDDSRNLAPEGWHVPTDEEWKELEIYLGMSQSEVNDTGWRGTNEGSKLAGRSDLWEKGDLENNTAFGESGFTALPGSKRGSYIGSFFSLCYEAGFWSATGGSGKAWRRSLNSNNSDIFRYDYDKRTGFSVRLVRD